MARCFHLMVFQVFASLFMVLRGPSEIFVLLANLGNCILKNLILSFPNSLTSRHYFLQQYKFFELNKMCEYCNYLLINDHCTFKNVQITFKLKNPFTCDSYNLIYIVICDKCKEEYTGETEEGKTKLRDRVRVYREQIQQPQYQP